MARHGSLAEQLATLGNATQKAANDNRQRKAANDNRPRYSSELPALRWLYNKRPELAPALADALPRPAANWFAEVEPTRQEIRPTMGELLKASHDDKGKQFPVAHETIGDQCYTTIGALRFRNGMLVEWGATKKGRKLKPVDRARPTGDKASKVRNPQSYLRLKPQSSPLHAEHYHRPMSGADAISSMYDPLPGVEAARALLRSLGVDGSVSAGQLPYGVTLYPTGVAEGSGFLGGISNPSGNSSSGAVMWESPEDRPSNAKAVIEEVAARGTLKSIGIRLGYSEDYADQAGGRALIEVAEMLDRIKKSKKVS